MVRLGYKKGIFLTNSKISPPAKRDCLNAYPEYEIDFVDGRELLTRIFDNVVLKAIWYEGVSIEKVNFALIIPVAARDLKNDMPFSINSENDYKIKFKVNQTRGQLFLQNSWEISTIAFPSYRPSTAKTIEMLMSGKVQTMNLVITGILHLSDYDAILEKISKKITEMVRSKCVDIKDFALIFGMPFIAPLSGERSGGRFQLETFSPVTIVNHDTRIEREIEWLLPQNEKDWRLPMYFQVSQMNYARWLNQKNNVCLKLSVICSATEKNRWLVEQKNEFQLEGWKKSLFMLVSNDKCDSVLFDEGCNTPERYAWNSDSTLLAWPNPAFFEDSSVIIDESDPFPSDQKIINKLKSIQEKVEKLGGQFVDPIKARHMIAIIASDPFPVSQNIEFLPVQLAYEIETVPTPIIPKSRHIQFTVCWQIFPYGDDLKSLGEKIEQIVAKMRNIKSELFEFKMEKNNPEQYPDDHYLMCHFDYVAEINCEKTDALLNKIEPELFSSIDNVESIIRDFFKSQRATKKFWEKVLWVRFD